MNDDLEFFGLDADATGRDLKRAYARMLKLHRPDQDPEGFRRVQEAYERLQGRLDGGGERRESSAPRASDVAPNSAAAADEAPFSDPAPGAGDGVDESGSALDPEFAREQAELAELDRLRALLASGEIAADELFDREQPSPALLVRAWNIEDEALLDWFAASVPAPVLLETFSAPIGANMVWIRGFIALSAGHVLVLAEELVAVIDHPALDKRIEYMAAVTARAVALEDVDLSRALEPLFVGRVDDFVHRAVDEARDLAPLLLHWLEQAKLPESTRRFLMIGSFLNDWGEQAALDDITEAARRNPMLVPRSFDFLARHVRASGFVWDTFAAFESGHQSEDDLDRFTRLQHRLACGRTSIDPSRPTARVLVSVLIFLPFILLGLFIGWLELGDDRTTIIITLILVFLPGLWSALVLGRLYDRELRKRIAAALIAEDTDLDEVTAALPANPYLGLSRSRLAQRLADDLGMHVLDLLARRARAANTGEDEFDDEEVD